MAHRTLKIANKKILITAGPTREPIDPVRYISNFSTGKMGIALAEACVARGASVTLVKGPTQSRVSAAGISVVDVVSAADMYAACTQYFAASDVIIFAAAVADYTPRHPATTKIKKQESEFTLELVKTKDIAYELGRVKKPGQVCVGFALETDNELANATSKLEKKNLDMIVLNSLKDEGAGFQHDTNKITIVDKKGNVVTFDLKAKSDVASDILDYIETQL
ncbi:MAG: phosphopantothenoylcysteine decarboxylase [Bacteroidetes bacterium]|nr:phosphopantothenoylcysteine decarboxylase [Bacteroidota bacterium]